MTQFERGLMFKLIGEVKHRLYLISSGYKPLWLGITAAEMNVASFPPQRLSPLGTRSSFKNYNQGVHFT